MSFAGGARAGGRNVTRSTNTTSDTVSENTAAVWIISGLLAVDGKLAAL